MNNNNFCKLFIRIQKFLKLINIVTVKLIFNNNAKKKKLMESNKNEKLIIYIFLFLRLYIFFEIYFGNYGPLKINSNGLEFL